MKISSKVLALTVLILVTAPYALAQDMCVGDFDYDRDCDGTDAARFKQDFGRSIFENPCPPDGPAPVPRTGQTLCYYFGSPMGCAGRGEDGDLRKGVPWPNPRFTDNENGAVTDNLTGLIWLKNADCFGMRDWYQALSDSNGLADGQCGLTDGSNLGDWRLPNKKELASLTHEGYYNPALPNTAGTGQWSQGDPFNNVQSFSYWSSTTSVINTYYHWVVRMFNGAVGAEDGDGDSYVWPVRGGQ